MEQDFDFSSYSNIKRLSEDELNDGVAIRLLAIENDTNIFTSLDTVKALLDVLEEITLKVSVINA